MQLSAAFGFTPQQIDAMTCAQVFAYSDRVSGVLEQRKNIVLSGVIEAIAAAFGAR